MISKLLASQLIRIFTSPTSAVICLNLLLRYFYNINFNNKKRRHQTNINYSMEMNAIISNAPKIELHAHLNGSLQLDSLREMLNTMYGDEIPSRFHDFLADDRSSVNLESVFEQFKLMHELSSTRQGLELMTTLVIRDFSKDNVVYLELRTTPKHNENMTKKEYLNVVLGAIEKYKEFSDAIIIKLLISFNRAEPAESAEESLDIALQLSEKYPNVIVGVDLCGDPHKGEFSDFINVLKRARNTGLKVTLHCGERQKSEDEIEAMLEFGMDRCGHGTFLTKEQLLHLNNVGIALECCMTSNIICKTVSDYQNHHAVNLIKDQSKIVTICTDDAGIFNTTLSNEFMMAAKHFNMNLEEFSCLSRNAIEHSFATKEEKKDLHRIFLDYLSNLNEIKL